MIDVKAFGGDPIKWALEVYALRDALGLERKCYFDSYGSYITTVNGRSQFAAPCFSDMDTVKMAMLEAVK